MTMQQNYQSTGSVYQNIGGYFNYLEKVWTDIQETRKVYRQLKGNDKKDALELIYDYEKQLYRSVKWYMEKTNRKIKIKLDDGSTREISREDLIDEQIAEIDKITKNQEFSVCSFTSSQIISIKKKLEIIDEHIWMALGESGLLPKKGYSDGSTW